MKPTPAIIHYSKQQKTISKHHHGVLSDSPIRKFHPASRHERLASWNRRMQSLFTRQAY